MSNPAQPVYTIAYRANNGGNVFASNLISGPAAATYVTASKQARHGSHGDINSFNSESEPEEQNYRTPSKSRYLKKVRYDVKEVNNLIIHIYHISYLD